MTSWIVVWSESFGPFIREAEIVLLPRFTRFTSYFPHLPLRGTCAFEKRLLRKQLVVLLLKAVPLLGDQPSRRLSTFDTLQAGHFPYPLQSLDPPFVVQNVRHKDHRARTHRKWY